MFVILEKIARLANDTQSRFFLRYRLLNRLQLIGHHHLSCDRGHITILLDHKIEILHVSG